jgi:2-keto-3-deoxy-L-rhamnonate aldolase
MHLIETQETYTPETLSEVRRLQYIVSKAEEFIGRFGVIGIKEAVYRVTGMGTLEGGRLPLRGKLTDSDWEMGREKWFTEIEKTEAEL